jgi:hypothetical protein
VFKKAIKVNGEIMELTSSTYLVLLLENNIFEWGENFVQNHPNCIFEELEQTFCK